MKQLIYSLVVAITLTACGQNNGYNNGVHVNSAPTASVTPSNSSIGDNLDLQALGEIVRNSANATDIETKLNADGGINNLDLNGDGKVDYIQVTEYGEGDNRGFSFTVDNGGGNKQEVATIELNKAGGDVNMNIQGNQNVYGNNAYYSSSYPMHDMLLYAWLFSYHPVYRSPYYFGYYPSHYRPYYARPYSTYNAGVRNTYKTTTIRRTTTRPSSKVSSPNSSYSSSKMVNDRTRSLANPTKSQKSFSATKPSNSKPKTTGFGSSSRSSNSPSNRSSSSSSSFGSSSRSSSKPKSSSFGSSSSSRSSGSRSSSFGSSSRSSSSRSSSRSSGSRRSDMRFKDSIQTLDNSLAKICLLTGVSYKWKVSDYPKENFDNTKQIGFLAQDLSKVYPTLVHDRGDGYNVVDYDLLVPALVEAIKELNSKVVHQDSVINVLSLKK